MDTKLTPLEMPQLLKKVANGETIENCHIAVFDLREHQVAADIDIKNSIIGQIILTGCEVQHKLSLENVTVENVLNAGRDIRERDVNPAKFHSAVIFKNCKFKDRAIFGHCEFKTLMSCQDCVFYEDAVFDKAQFQEQAYFWGSQFKHKVSFNHASFTIEAHFDKCDFRDSVQFEHAHFKGQDASFNYITTQLNINFSHIKCDCFFACRKSTIDGELNFKDADFHGEVDFQDSELRGKSIFENAQFHQRTNFSYVQFMNAAFFYGCSFAQVTFLNAQFHGEVLFNLDSHTRRSLDNNDEIRAAQFHDHSDFTNVRFHKRAIFEQVLFDKQSHFASCFFGEQANFIGITVKDYICFDSVYCNQEFSAVNAQLKTITFNYANINRRLDLSDATLEQLSFYKAAVDLIVIEKEQMRRKLIHEDPQQPSYDKCAEEYLLLKESFFQRGLHDEEDWAYFKFRQAKRKYRTKKNLQQFSEASFVRKLFYLSKLPLSLFERILIDRATGYGTRPLNITIVAISFILFFGAIYSSFPDTLVKPPSMPFGFAQAVYFSFATFTTMGFGDIQPRLDTIMPYVVSTEAFLGLFIMTLFVGTYTRKIIR
ncbi:potassium channel family protein [Candidatus Uabimicrobium amorphum]|uniref:Potassium channel domain-containing protein n=1 Tax=Uabimicrobium amorphum TaxID=2596890 RepID=A0A5S9IK13_UABAM|nr:pentapeptide repeat-containing protein [Candidatus Uabimicrobium amorphum]BBM82015.1 hypothetical protein UABAM_00358 [Candidatus Uabimicrobium amorphum]